MSKEFIRHLHSVPLFSGCSDKELEFVATRVDQLDFPPGRTLCEQDKSGADFFILLSGTAEARRDGKTVRKLNPGDFFGEIALLDNGPRTATVVTTSPSSCLVLGPSQFQDVLYQNADIAVRVLYAVAQRLRATTTLHAD